jgi:YfiH family protein
MSQARFVCAKWPAPVQVCTAITTRIGGRSTGAYRGLNLSATVGDSEAAVATNRALLRGSLALASDPLWLNQVHGRDVINLGNGSDHLGDGVYTATPGQVCAILSADCLPLLLCNRAGTEVAALHAGWRGLAAGILQSGVATMASEAHELLVWFGPAICARHYEVGPEVRDAFLSARAYPVGLENAFQPCQNGKWLANLVAIAVSILASLGVRQTFTQNECTYGLPERYYSHRREHPTGRQASLIWISPNSATSAKV